MPRRLAAAPVTGCAGAGGRVDARRAHGVAPFVSDAEAMPLYLFPGIIWWAVVAAPAATALGLGLWLDRRRVRVAAGLRPAPECRVGSARSPDPP